MMMARGCFNLLSPLLVLLLCGCGFIRDFERDAQTEKKGIERRFTLGGAPAEVVVGLSSEELALTDFLTVAVDIEFTEGVQISAPYLSEAVYGPLVLIEKPRESTQWSEENHLLTNKWEFRFEPIKSGEFVFKPFDIHFRLDKEKTDDPKKWPVYTIRTEEIPYRVTSVEVTDEDDIRDIKGLILPEYNLRPVALTGSVIALVFLTFGLIWRYKYLLNKQESPPVEKIDYCREALRRLTALEKQNYLDMEQFDQLHTELASILRYYVENYFGLRAQEQTTEEFVKDIRTSSYFTAEQHQVLDQFLRMADLVKFATFDPGSTASQEAMQSIRNFIESTGKADEV